MRTIKDRVVLVTGAASGIGQALAVQFAKEGANLVITDINKDTLMATVEQVKSLGREVLPVIADIGNRNDVERLCRVAIENHKRVDILVNNAGVALYADFADTDLSDWEWLMGVDFWGPVYALHYLVPGMIERKSGHIVNLSSWMGLLGQPSNSAYSAAKFGIMGLSEALRVELNRYNIGVTVVCPGVVQTNIFKSLKIKGFRSGVRNMPAFLGLSPERISKRIIHAVKRNRSMVITGLGRSAYALKRISPRAARIIGYGGAWAYSKFREDR
ncbi:MAG: SDR family oxidoreductase [Proteobacteria bacterium]|nr:SDR family oxidoreductase [Pseudomonadota bacterium]